MGYFTAPNTMDGGLSPSSSQPPCGAEGSLAMWPSVWQTSDSPMQFASSMQMFPCRGVAVPAQGFDTGWPEDLGLAFPAVQPGQPSKARRKRKSSKEGLRTPSSVGTPIFSDSG